MPINLWELKIYILRQVVRNASFWNSLFQKNWNNCLPDCPFSFLIISHIEILCQCLMKQLAWLWLTNVWSWMIDRPAKICKILIEDTSFWEVSGKLWFLCEEGYMISASTGYVSQRKLELSRGIHSQRNTLQSSVYLMSCCVYRSPFWLVWKILNEKTEKYIVKFGMTGVYYVSSVLLCYNSVHLFLISEY